MCGHAGYAFSTTSWSAGCRARDEVLRRMGDSIAHRGPDDEGLWRADDDSLGAVFRRLSIIDLEGGHQPIPNEEGDVVVLVNGEIYNFVALRRELEDKGHVFRTRSDVEVVAHLYEEHGDDLASRLVGMFAFAVIDTRGGGLSVLIGRDPLGIKPLYFTLGDAGFAWASEPKALLAMGSDGPSRVGVERELRPDALLEYLMRGFIGGEHSAWAGIERLRPGSTLRWTRDSDQRPTQKKYWDLPLGLRDEATKSEVLEWTDRVVSDRLVADVPLGAFLSGGVDSSAVVTSMALRQSDPVIACSVGFHEKSHNELDVACRTARSLGLVHHTEYLDADPRLALEVLPWLFDEPLADPSTVPTYLVSKMAREHVTVALSGDGGDETFAGYRRYLFDQAENRLRRRLGPLGRGVAGALGRMWPRMEWAPRYLRGRRFCLNVAADPALAYFQSVSILDRSEALALLAPDVARAVRDDDPFHEFEAHYRRPEVDSPLYRAQFADMHTYLTDQILTKVDRASMGVSLEARVPLLDHRFVERFANLPEHQKIHGKRGKYLLRESQRERLSEEVLDGKKRGFDTPLDAWIRGPLKDEVKAATEGLPEEWFDRRALAKLTEEHAAGRRNHGRTLWSLFVLERWRLCHRVRGLAS